MATPLEEYSQSTRWRPGMPGALTRRPTNQRSGTEKYSVISNPPSQRGVVTRCSTGRRGQPEGWGRDAGLGLAEVVGIAAAGVVCAGRLPVVPTGLPTFESEPHPASPMALA